MVIKKHNNPFKFANQYKNLLNNTVLTDLLFLFQNNHNKYSKYFFQNKITKKLWRSVKQTTIIFGCSINAIVFNCVQADCL